MGVHQARWAIVSFAFAVLLASAAPPLRANDPKDRKVLKEELPRIAPTEPDEVLGTFHLARGCRLELVAAEPMVSDPVDACFDEFGRMYVAEMHGYPFSQEPTKLNSAGGGPRDAGVIRLLQDTDNDGRMDRSVVFADKISWPTSVCCYEGGLFVLAPQYLYYFKDTDGDDRADVREIVLTGFGRQNVQGLANNMKWGLDNRIYFAAGRNPKSILHRGVALPTMVGADLCFDPKTETFELVTGGLQFGHCMDDWGNRFVCRNSNHIQHVIYPLRYLLRNPYLAVSPLVRNIATDGANARVFRASPPEPWRIIRQQWRAEAKGYRLVLTENGSWEFVPLDPSKKKGEVPTEYPVGHFTSATGVTIYRGGAYPEEFKGNAFVGDVGGNLVHRKRLTPAGVSFSADRADRDEELVRSTDNWFRPVNFVNAPDGTLYVLDMYRETVEHPYSIPDEIKRSLHLQSGSDRGRIYRIVTPDMRRLRPARLGDLSSARLVAELESDNIWNRMTAQRLLWQRQDRGVVSELEKLARTSPDPRARTGALYLLSGSHVLNPQQVLLGLRDLNPRVVEHGVRFAEHFLEEPEVLTELVALAVHPDDRVRFQVAFSLGQSRDESALGGLARLARDVRSGEEIRTAVLSSVVHGADRLVIDLLQDDEFLQRDFAATRLAELALLVGADPDGSQCLRVLDRVTELKMSVVLQQAVLTALGEGLRRRGTSIADLLVAENASGPVQRQVAAVFAGAAKIAWEQERPLVRRAGAIRLLGFGDFQLAAEHLREFLSPRTPRSLQREAVVALSCQDSDRTGPLLLEDWQAYSPQLRRDVTDALLSSLSRIEVLLQAVEKKSVQAGELERSTKQLLVNHSSPAVGERARRLFGGEVSPDRAAVIAEYQQVLDLEGDPGRGFETYKKKCSVCHRVGNAGFSVAPDLVSVQNKSAADLVVAILDPNRDAQPDFNTYNVLTENGRLYNGIIAGETTASVTLRRAEARQDVIFRKTIEEFTSTGISLMPEGLEKELSPQDLADVIAFVKSIPTAVAEVPVPK